MARPHPPSVIRSLRARPAARLVATACAIVVPLLCAPAAAAAPGFKKPRKTLPEGWDATVQFGADATSGVSRTSSFSGGVDTTYRGDRWEHRVVVEAKQSAWKGEVKRLDDDGEVVRGASGEPLTDTIRKKTFDRRFVGFEPRWFFRQRRNYLFALVDLETNEPKDLKRTSRQIAGVGYSRVVDKVNWFTAGVGLGRKTYLNVADVGDVSGIGYVELAYARLLGERTKFKVSLDSDFGSENRSTGLDLELKWRLEAPASLKLDYETRKSLDTPDASSPRETSVSISFEIDVL